MEFKRIVNIYFSATGNTKKILHSMGANYDLPMVDVDITSYSEHDKEYTFYKDDLVLVGMPVYGGRIPAPAQVRLAHMHGNHTMVVLMADYGNRAYEDALLEMKNIVERNGFYVGAAAAFVAEHSIMHSVAANRPDAQDEIQIKTFMQEVKNKFAKLEKVEAVEPLTLPGTNPYRSFDGVPLKPKANNDCTACGLCASLCPMHAIPVEDPKTTNHDVCISCMRCIHECPQHARKLNKIMLAASESVFARKNRERKEPEFFL